MPLARNQTGALRGWLLATLIVVIFTAVIGGVVAYRLSRSPALAQIPSFVAPSGAEGWRQDLRYLAAEIPRRHKNAFHTLSRAQFEHSVSELAAALPSLNDDQIVAGLMRITASIGDGHTHVETPPNFHCFPLDLYWFADALRVTKASPAYARALGTRVVQIGDATSADAYKVVSTLIPQGESELWVRRTSTALLVCPEVLHGLGVLPAADRGRFVFEDDAGNRFSLELDALLQSQRETDKREWFSAARTEPLYVQRPNEDEWFTYLDADRTLFFKFNRAPGYWGFRRFSNRLFDLLDHRPARRLVIDLRNNRGGDSTKFRWLFLPRLSARRFRRQCFACPREINQPPYLYVLIGRYTYSAGMITAVELQQEAAAVLVGGSTGGRPDAYDEDRPFELPNSHLVVFVSTRYYRLVQEDTPGLLANKEIDLNWSDFVAGRDPVLEWVLAQPADP